MKNLVKSKIENNGHPLGTFFQTGSATTAECLGLAGLDYIIIDTEHGPFEVESAMSFIRAARLTGTTPFVRVKDSSRAAILKMLDAGAMGLVIPNVRSAQEAREIVTWGKYFPLGERGIAPTSGNAYWTQDWARNLDDYFRISNTETLLIPQCETIGCLEQIEEIAAIDGVDGIFVGPFDLSAALGRPGDFENPDHQAAIERVVKACRNAGKLTFIYASSYEETRMRYEQGFDSVTYGMDSLLLIDAAKQLVARLATA